MTLDIVAAGAASFGLRLAPETLDRLARFVGLLLAANARLNLTRIVEPAEVARRHLLDSLPPTWLHLQALRILRGRSARLFSR